MSKLLEDLKRAKDIINEKYPFQQFVEIYPFSNENLTGSFKHFDFNNKKCLSVLASSDQVLDMHLLGAKKITTFDINPLTKYYFYLKKAALLSNLPKEEYLKFFYPYCISNKKGLALNTFDKLVPNLSGDNLKFWSELFNDFKPPTISSMLFSLAINDIEELPTMINYLNGNNYEILKEKINDMNINFMNANITALPYMIKENFDFIYLSNIMEYAHEIYKSKISDYYRDNIMAYGKYKQLILEFSKHLNKGGNILICYFFNASRLNLVPINEITEKIFHEKYFNFYQFEPKPINYEDNGILVYTKQGK